ncbi:MAG: hypothetical protein EOP84_30880 [Verrucomicrobiaceae bacterium]|nr:MAG: hypothetical protein EOP84_30880 [Verrucomicrobiaceae bacterium]
MAYESAELAAMCSVELLWSVRRKTEVLRETLVLPVDSGLHGTAPAELISSYDSQTTLAVPIIEHMIGRDLLTLWIASSDAMAQHAVFINPCHSAFEKIAVVKRQMVLTRPSWSGNVQIQDRTLAQSMGLGGADGWSRSGFQAEEPKPQYGLVAGEVYDLPSARKMIV